MQPNMSKYFVIYWRVFEKLKACYSLNLQSTRLSITVNFLGFIQSVHVVGWYSLATASKLIT
jgi:hypothetical protein